MYITPAIVCGSRNTMTSDKSYLLFTQELGMLWATARSVRMEKSKQRNALQDFSIIRISLVQGRAVWRIGSVEEFSNPFLESLSRDSRAGVSAVIKSIRRYIQGEEITPRTFTDAQHILALIPRLEKKEDIQMYQNVFMLRMIQELGYLKDTKSLNALVDAETIHDAYLCYVPSMTKVLEDALEHASSVSHL